MIKTLYLIRPNNAQEGIWPVTVTVEAVEEAEEQKKGSSHSQCKTLPEFCN